MLYCLSVSEFARVCERAFVGYVRLCRCLYLHINNLCYIYICVFVYTPVNTQHATLAVALVKGVLFVILL